MSRATAASAPLPSVDREGFAAFLLRMRGAGLDSKPLMTAIEAVPRRGFVAPDYHSAVWSPRMIPIDCGATLEGLDHLVSVITSLDLEENHRVLEIGTGSGYSAAVMGKLVKRVYSIERFARLAKTAQSRLRGLAIDNVIVTHGDGTQGGSEGPFDRILVWPTLDSVPRGFADQLVSGGKLVCPIGAADQAQVLVRLTKVGSRYEREDIGTVRGQMIASGLPETL